ncbi:transposase [Nostoc sp. C052]|nr:transposase [Nostoc sp. C052]
MPDCSNLFFGKRLDVLVMAGRFEGLSDLEWKLFEDIFPKQASKRGKGMPHAPYRYVLNSLLYILITGCRWCDLPRGDIWASKSSSHRWLKRWRSDGTFEYIQGRVLAIANEKGLINWDFGAVDGSFSPAQWEEVKKLRMEGKGKVFLSIHLPKVVECPWLIALPQPMATRENK